MHDHVVLLALALVTGHLATTEHGLHSACNQIHTNPHIGRTLTVNLQFDFRLVQAQIGVDLDKPRIFGQFVLKRSHCLRQVLVAVRGDDDVIDRPLRKALSQ